MDQNQSQIEREIELERRELGTNLDTLQSKVQEITDWRIQFQKRPMLMLGVALGGGALLASLTRGRRKPRRHDPDDRIDGRDEYRRGTELQKNHALDTFDTIKGALIGVAAKTFRDFLGQIVPGFTEQFQTTAHEKSSRRDPAMSVPLATGTGAIE